MFMACQIYTIGYWVRGAIAPITDVLEEEFHTNASQIGLLSSVLYISYVVFQLPSGLLLQIYTGEFILLTSAFALSITMFTFSYSQSVEFAIPIHFLNGLFLTPAWITCVSIASDRFGSENTALLTGMMIFWCKTVLIGLTTFQATIYQQYDNWRLPFIILTITLIITSMIALIFVICEQFHRSKNHQTRGNSLTGDELDTFDENTKKDDDNTPLIKHKDNKSGCFCSIYLQNDDKEKKSLGDIVSKVTKSFKKTISNPWNYLLGAWGFCMSSVSYALNGLWLVSYLMIKFDYNRTLATFIVGLFYIGTAFGSLILGQITNKYKIRKIIMIFGVLLIIIGSCSIIYILDKNASMFLVIALNIISGLGYGSVPAAFALIREYNNYYQCSDTATAFVYAFIVASGFVVQYLIGNLLDYNWKQRGGNDYIDDNPLNERQYNVSDYDFAFMTIAVLLGISLIISLFIKETRGKDVDYESAK